MPIEDMPSEIRAKIRDKNDFEKFFGYTDIDSSKGIRAEFGKAKVGSDLIQAFRFNKAFGWTASSARNWLKNQGIDMLKDRSDFSDEYILLHEGNFLHNIKPENEHLLGSGLKGNLVRLMDVADVIKRTIPKESGGIALGGPIIESNATFSDISVFMWGNLDNGLKEKMSKDLPPELRDRVKFVNLNRAPMGSHMILAKAMYSDDSPILVPPVGANVALSADIDAWGIAHANGPSDLGRNYPAFSTEFPGGSQVQIHILGDDGVCLIGENGIFPFEIGKTGKALNKLFEKGTILHSWMTKNENDSGVEFLVDDIWLDSNNATWTQDYQSRYAILCDKFKKNKKKSNVKMAEMILSNNQEELSKASNGKMLLVRPAMGPLDPTGINPSMMVMNNGPVFPAMVCAVNSPAGLARSENRYMLGLSGNPGSVRDMIPVGVTNLTRARARVGDWVLISSPAVDVHTDLKSKKLWFDAIDARVILTNIRPPIIPENVIQGLVWGEGNNEPMNYPVVFDERMSLGTFNSEWENHMALERAKFVQTEALAERIIADENLAVTATLTEKSQIYPMPDGRFVVHKHFGKPGEFRTHMDLREDWGDRVQTMAIQKDKPCPCNGEKTVELCCTAYLKPAQSRWWMGPDVPEDEFEELERGSFESGLMTDGVHEIYINGIGPMNAEHKERLVFIAMSKIKEYLPCSDAVKKCVDAIVSDGGDEANAWAICKNMEAEGKLSELSEGKDPYVNPDGSFKGGFDGCVKDMMSKGHDEESAKRLCAYIGRESGKIPMAHSNGFVLVKGLAPVPLILSEIFTDENVPIPPRGISALPRETMKKVPNDMKFWTIADDTKRKAMLVALRQSMRKNEVHLMRESIRLTASERVDSVELTTKTGETLKAHNFSVRKQIWSDNSGPRSRLILNIDVGDDSIAFGTDVDLTKANFAKLDNIIGDRNSMNCGELDSDSPLAPAKGMKSKLDLLECGKVVMLKRSDLEFIMEFRGKQFRGRYNLKKNGENDFSIERVGDVALADSDMVPMKVKCVSLSEGIWNGKFYPRSEIKNSKLTPLKGEDIVKFRADHSKSAHDVHGKVDGINYQENFMTKHGPIPALIAEYTVNDPFMARAIMDGDVDGVSWGMDQDVDLSTNPPTARNYKLYELSGTPVPACTVCRNIREN